jgi:hypothetical protein
MRARRRRIHARPRRVDLRPPRGSAGERAIVAAYHDLPSLHLNATARAHAFAAALLPLLHQPLAQAADTGRADARPTASAATASSGAAPATSSASRRVVDLAIRAGKVDAPNQTVSVPQGADVELRWTSDRPIALHLHGYDIEKQVTPGAPAVMSFKARLPGRFPVSEHRSDAQHHRAVVYLEVRP